MTQLQKQLIEKLSIIAPYIEQIDALLYLVQYSDLNDEMLRMIEQIITTSYELVKTQENQHAFEQSLSLVKKIRAKESRESEDITIF